MVMWQDTHCAPGLAAGWWVCAGVSKLRGQVAAGADAVSFGPQFFAEWGSWQSLQVTPCLKHFRLKEGPVLEDFIVDLAIHLVQPLLEKGDAVALADERPGFRGRPDFTAAGVARAAGFHLHPGNGPLAG